MSKRSFRRLAAVTGAALALGTMAPALAARVEANNTVDVEASPEAVITDVVNITDALPIPALPTSTVLGVINSVVGTATTTVAGAPALVLGNAGALLGTASGLSGDLLAIVDGALLSADVDLSLLGAVNVGLDADVLGTTAILGDLSGIAFGTAGGALTTVGGVGNLATGIALGAVGTAVGTVTPVAGLALGTIGSLPGTVIGTTGLLTGLLDVSASGNVNVLASVLGSM